MSVPTKDGAWISATRVVRVECSKCGVVEVTRWPMNDRETDELIAKHAREKHGGTNRY
jgi:hypothetical protein